MIFSLNQANIDINVIKRPTETIKANFQNCILKAQFKNVLLLEIDNIFFNSVLSTVHMEYELHMH